MEKSLATYFNWILSFIFVAAGVLKILNPENTGDILIFLFEIEYNTSLIIVYTIAFLEIIFGIALFFGVKKKLVQGLILCSCSLFLLIAMLGFSNGWQLACGCFGRFSFGRFDLAMVLRNSLLEGMALWLIYGDSRLKKLILKGINN